MRPRVPGRTTLNPDRGISMAKEKEQVSKGEVLAPEKQVGGSLPVPAFMQQHVGKGLESLGMGDFEIPRLKLLQAISPEVTDGRGKAGNYWHTVLEQDLGGSLEIIPLYLSKSAILWRPREDGGGILARADDGINWSPSQGQFTVKIDKRGTTRTWKLAPTVAESRLLEWGTYDEQDPQSQPAATKMLNCAVWVRSIDSPVVMTFQRSSLKAGSKFAGKLKLSNLPIFGRKFRLFSVDDTNSSNQEFKNMSLEAVGVVENEEEFKRYEEMYQNFKALGIKIKDIEGLQDEDAPAGGRGDDAPAPEGAPRL